MAFTAPQLAEMVVKSKLYMNIQDDDTQYHADGIAVFCSATDATAATVQVTDTTVVLIITGGANVGTVTLTLADAANDTMTELASVINGTSGWTGNLVGKADVDTDLLVRQIATNALAQSQENILVYENNDRLELLITNLLDRIETTLGRDIMSTAYTGDLFNIQHDGLLMLEHPEVSQIQFVGTDLDSGLNIKYTGTDTHATVEVTATAVETVSRVGATLTTVTSLFSASVSTTAMASTINALSGWTASVVNANPSAYLERRGVQDAKGVTVNLETWNDHDGAYTVQYDEGMMTFHGGVARSRVRVDYTAGFSTLPSDVEQALLEVVKAAWDSGTQDSNVEEEKLGDHMYKLARGGLSSMAGKELITQLSKGYERVLP